MTKRSQAGSPKPAGDGGGARKKAGAGVRPGAPKPGRSARADRRPSAEQTTQDLVDAVIRLLDRGDAKALTCRGIAREAGVNHGLVHHYFESKDALIEEATRRASETMHAQHPKGIKIGWSFAYLLDHPALARVVARLCLDGPRSALGLAHPGPEVMEERLRAIERGLERIGLAGAVHPRVVYALSNAALLGWVVFRPLFEGDFDLPPDADEQLGRLLEVAEGLLQAAGT